MPVRYQPVFRLWTRGARMVSEPALAPVKRCFDTVAIGVLGRAEPEPFLNQRAGDPIRFGIRAGPVDRTSARATIRADNDAHDHFGPAPCVATPGGVG